MINEAKLGEGRKLELQKNLQTTLERYKNVYGLDLPLSEVRAFLEDTATRERRDYLKERMGKNFSRSDAEYLLTFLGEREKQLRHAMAVEESMKEPDLTSGEAADPLTAGDGEEKDGKAPEKRKPGRPRNPA